MEVVLCRSFGFFVILVSYPAISSRDDKAPWMYRFIVQSNRMRDAGYAVSPVLVGVLSK